MNSSAHLQVFLDAPSASPAETRKQPAKAESGNKQVFEQHLRGNLEQPSSRAERDNSPVDKKESAQQRLEVRRGRPEASEATKIDSDGKDLPISGEKLPLPEETQDFLSSLTADQRSDFLKELQAWLQGLSDDELAELENALLDDDLVGLQELLPEELDEFLLQLTQQLGISLDDLHQEVQQLLVGLQKADIDFRQLAALRFDSQSSELRLMTDAAGRKNSKGYSSERKDSEAMTRGRETTEAGKDTFAGRQDKQEVGADKQDGRLQTLVTRLGRGDASALSSRSGGDSMQQLIQAAGLGLGNTAAAQPAAARMAASMPAASMMSQAAAQANAEALANRISVMQSRGMQVAEMRLDPPDLGNLRVQIRMQGDQASIVFQSPNAQARDLLENALPRLKEMLEEQGMDLADASVSDESSSEEGESEQGLESEGQGSGFAGSSDTEEAETIAYFEQPLGLVDYYA